MKEDGLARHPCAASCLGAFSPMMLWRTFHECLWFCRRRSRPGGALMFTGIVASVGRIERLESRGGDMRLHVDTADLDLADVALGDSNVVFGCCFKDVVLADNRFAGFRTYGLLEVSLS